MIVYDGSPEADLLLIEWWTRMAATADLDRAFSVVHASVGAFFQSFRPPSTLLYKVEGQRIWFAAWFDPVMNGAFYGLWIAPHMRITMAALEAVEESIAFGLSKYPVLIGATRIPKLARQTERFGAKVLGDIPKLFDGETATIGYITAETFRAPERENNPNPPEVPNG
jgi:hypothetical protein